VSIVLGWDRDTGCRPNVEPGPSERGVNSAVRTCQGGKLFLAAAFATPVRLI